MAMLPPMVASVGVFMNTAIDQNIAIRPDLIQVGYTGRSLFTDGVGFIDDRFIIYIVNYKHCRASGK